MSTAPDETTKERRSESDWQKAVAQNERDLASLFATTPTHNPFAQSDEELSLLDTEQDPFAFDTANSDGTHEADITLLTGIATGTATKAEQALWDERFAHDEHAQAQLAAFLDLMHDENITSDTILSREDVGLDQYEELPEDFWTEPNALHLPPERFVVTGSSVAAIDEPIPSTSGLSGFLSWFPQLRESALVLACLAALFIWNVPRTNQTPLLQGSARSVAPLSKMPQWRGVGHKGASLRQTPPPHTTTNKAPYVLQMLLTQHHKTHIAPRSFRVLPGTKVSFKHDATKATQPAYLSFFFVNQAGQFVQLLPTAGKTKQILPGTVQTQESGVTLTSVKGAERIYACVSKQPLTHTQLKQTIQRALKQKGLATWSTLPLPCISQNSWLLK